MRILFVSTVHPTPVLPTMGTFNRVLLEGLRAEGHEVRAVVPIPWTRAGWRMGAPVPQLDTFRWWYLPVVSRGRMHHSLSRQLRRTWRRTRNDWQPDIVVGYWVDPDGSAALDLAKELQVPGVLLVGGTDINELSQDAKRGAVIRETLHRADMVITIGDALASAVVALGIPTDRVRSFQRGVDHRVFHPGDRAAARLALHLPTESPILLWVGRMVGVKGLDTLLRAVTQLHRPERAHLYLIGQGPLERELRTQAERLGLSSTVHFVGRVAHEALAEWYRAADLVVLPSRSEGMPNVLLEALACGTPFVSSRVGSVPELAESPDWLVPPDDPDALASALAKLLETPPLVLRRSTDDRGAARQFAGVLAETVDSLVAPADRPMG